MPPAAPRSASIAKYSGSPSWSTSARGRLVALLDALPELALVDAGERRAILLALVLEDRADLEPQLLLRHRHQEVGLGHRPLLPRAAVEPDLRRLAAVALERALDRLLAHAVRAVRVGEVAGDQDDLGPQLLEQRRG